MKDKKKIVIIKFNKRELKSYFEDGIKLVRDFGSDFNNPCVKEYFQGYADAMKDAIEDLKLKKR